MTMKTETDKLPGVPGDSGILSWLSALVSLQRGWSYVVRPPEFRSVTSNVIDRFVPYPVWGWAAIIAGALILVGWVWSRGALLEITGHVIAATVCVGIASSVLLSAIFLDQPWAASGALVLMAVVHLERIKIAAARRLGG